MIFSHELIDNQIAATFVTRRRYELLPVQQEGGGDDQPEKSSHSAGITRLHFPVGIAQRRTLIVL